MDSPVLLLSIYVTGQIPKRGSSEKGISPILPDPDGELQILYT
jgi:hypothetical protein